MTTTLLTEWSRLLLGSLARAGVERVVLSPGSRSTPFAWAALQEPGLHCHSVWDERVAGFFALGQARVTGKPSLLVCTSGSAVANYFPALIEASLSNLPLLVLTADRPFELQHSAAPQAIDQVKIFGDSVRAFFELGVPDSAPSALSGVVRSVSHAVHSARSPRPGPVHLNARARKPLEPVRAEDPAARELGALVDELLARGPTRASGGTLRGDLRRLCQACKGTARGLIMVGPQPAFGASTAEALSEFAAACGYPVLCEATSQVRWSHSLANGAVWIDGFEWLLRSKYWMRDLRPDLIVSFGGTPTSTGYERMLTSGFTGTRFVIAEHGFPDPHGLAGELVSSSSEAAALSAALELRSAPLEHQAERDHYRQRFQHANRSAWAAVSRELARPTTKLSEACAVRSVLDALPEPCLLVLGNSLPIREVDAYCPGGARRVRVLSQRGANGIDGLVSGAAGSASSSDEPCVLLLGDVSFLHDLGGLAVAREARGPFALVIIDNAGGRIFEQLPIFAELEKQTEASQFWLTPPRVELEHAAKLFGYAYERVTEVAAVRAAMARATTGFGVTLVHIVVEASSARASEQRVQADLECSAGDER